MLKKYPELGELALLRKTKDSVVRFAVLLCEGHIEAESEETRIKKAAAIAGLSKTEVGELISEGYISKEFIMIIESIFALLNNQKYEMWFSIRLNIMYMHRGLRTVPDSDNTKAMTDELDKRQKVLDALVGFNKHLDRIEADMFPNETVKRSIERVAAAKMVHYPEQYARENTTV